MPCTSDYAPILSGGDKKKVTADLGVQEWRRTHLSNFIFLCCKESLHDLHHILEAAGGKAITVPEDAKDLISFLSGRPWRRVEVRCPLSDHLYMWVLSILSGEEDSLIEFFLFISVSREEASVDANRATSSYA